MATWKVPGGGRPAGLKVLDPGYLHPFPYHTRSYEYLTHWKYLDGMAIDGVTAQLDIPVEQVMYDSNWNPNHPFRGLSPAITGISEISTNYYANRFNASYFQNGAHKDLVVRFPKGTDHQVARDWVDKWQLNHSIFHGGAFTVSAVIAEDMEIIEPGQTSRDGQFLSLTERNQESIMTLWGVPAILYNVNNAKYDSADAQLEMFYENVLMPQMTLFSEYIQKQLIDVHFRTSASTDKRKCKMLARTQKAFEKARENTESDIVFILDPDSLPIAAKLRINQLDAMDKHRRMTASSYQFSAEWAGIDREANHADDLIYIDSSMQRIDPVQQPADPRIEQLEEEVKKLAAATAKPQPVDAAVLKALRSFYTDYRALVLAAAASANGRYDKQGAVKLLAERGFDQQLHDRLVLQIARDHLNIRGILTQNEKESAIKQVKAYMNEAMKASSLRGIISEKGH